MQSIALDARERGRTGVHTSAKMGCKRMKREVVSDFQVLAQLRINFSRVCFFHVHIFDSAISQNWFARTKVFILPWSFPSIIYLC